MVWKQGFANVSDKYGRLFIIALQSGIKVIFTMPVYFPYLSFYSVPVVSPFKSARGN